MGHGSRSQEGCFITKAGDLDSWKCIGFWIQISLQGILQRLLHQVEGLGHPTAKEDTRDIEEHNGVSQDIAKVRRRCGKGRLGLLVAFPGTLGNGGGGKGITDPFFVMTANGPTGSILFEATTTATLTGNPVPYCFHVPDFPGRKSGTAVQVAIQHNGTAHSIAKSDPEVIWFMRSPTPEPLPDSASIHIIGYENRHPQPLLQLIPDGPILHTGIT